MEASSSGDPRWIAPPLLASGEAIRTTLVGEPSRPVSEGSSPRSATPHVVTARVLAFIFPLSEGILGVLASFSTVTTAGSVEESVSTPLST